MLKKILSFLPSVDSPSRLYFRFSFSLKYQTYCAYEESKSIFSGQIIIYIMHRVSLRCFNQMSKTRVQLLEKRPSRTTYIWRGGPHKSETGSEAHLRHRRRCSRDRDRMMVKDTDEARPRRNDPDAPLCHGVLRSAAAPDKPASRRRFLSKAPITRLNAPSSFVFFFFYMGAMPELVRSFVRDRPRDDGREFTAELENAPDAPKKLSFDNIATLETSADTFRPLRRTFRANKTLARRNIEQSLPACYKGRCEPVNSCRQSGSVN